MIRLIRPLVPQPERAMEIFQHAIRERVFSNFGTLHQQLMNELSAIGAGWALPTTSGTLGLEIALRSLKLKPAARVAIPDFTHSGTLLAAVRADLYPVLVGVDSATWTLMPEMVPENEVDAVVVVSPFGYPVNFAAWEEWSATTKVPLVYDLAGAWGTFPTTKNPRCYSLHATKNMGIGEGGFVVFSELDQRVAAMRMINFDTLPDRSIGSLDGCNGKMDEIHAAFTLAALERFHRQRVDRRISDRVTLLRFYAAELGAFVPAGVRTPSLCVLGEMPAAELEAASDKLGAVFRRYYPLLSRMPACKSVERISVSGDEMGRCVALPSDVDLTMAYQVVDVVKRFVEGRP